MRLLFLGDVMAAPGLRVVNRYLPALREELNPDVVVANAENIAGGAGVTSETAAALLAAGVDVLTNGNHAWDKREAFDYIRREPRLLRPHNYPAGSPGSGWFVATTSKGERLGILNLMGLVYMHPSLACPFRAADEVLATKPQDLTAVFVDFHAEVTSEKHALAWYLDGRVSAVVGTHTHVPTADERLLPGGTAYLTDVGMCGCYDSVIGLDTAKAIRRFVDKLPERYDIADGRATLCGALIDIDAIDGKATAIRRISMSE